MKSFVAKITKQQFAVFICACLMAAMLFSKYALSICMISLVTISVFSLDWQRKFPVILNPHLIQNFRSLYHNKALLSITLFFFIVLLSGLYSDDGPYFWERVRIRTPFLFLPFAFVSIPSFSKRQYLGLFNFFLVIMAITCVGVGMNYWQDFEEITQKLSMGQALPTPINHIRFSLALAFSIIAGIQLIQDGFYIKYPFEKYLTLLLTVGLFIFIHVLSVRSGLAALYLCLFILALRYIIHTRNLMIGLGVVVFLLGIPIVAYQTIPSFQKRMEYARFDWYMHQTGQGDQYSDSDRLTSLKVGMLIGNKHALLGVGAGDLKKEVEQTYAKAYPNVTEAKMPHNQLVSVYAGTGFLGLSLFLIAFFLPLFYQHNYRHLLCLSLHIIVFFSFMSESTIENAIGTAFYVFFLLLILNYLKDHPELPPHPMKFSKVESLVDIDML